MLTDDIDRVLSADNGLSAAELAARLEAPEREVSFVLFAAHHRFHCDDGSPPRWWSASSFVRETPSAVIAPPVPTDSHAVSLRLYAWQTDALKAWARQGCCGVVEAVTGTGKTMLGVVAALHELACHGQVVVLVPTVELQHQWVAELESRLPVHQQVGRMGAGYGDRLTTHDVLVALVNSARALDVRPIRQGGLLVADECHRYGSAVNHLALDLRFSHRLGLSATYARDDDGHLSWLAPYFGATCFRLGYARAVADGVTARFTVTMIGVRFSSTEQALYDELTNTMAALRARLIRMHAVPEEPFDVFIRAVMALAGTDGEDGRIARGYRTAMLERRHLLADTPAKDVALGIVAPAIREADRAIVFTQSIAASERSSALLTSYGLRSGVVHSARSLADRRVSLRQFAAGKLQVLSAPRVLDEGINVPAADLAVIVGASHSRRQMIQRMGRILRRKADGRRARFIVLFVEGSVEDPRLGAHEAFLSEITDVADEVSCFPSTAAAARPDAVLDTLWPVSVPQ